MSQSYQSDTHKQKKIKKAQKPQGGPKKSRKERGIQNQLQKLLQKAGGQEALLSQLKSMEAQKEPEIEKSPEKEDHVIDVENEGQALLQKLQQNNADVIKSDQQISEQEEPNQEDKKFIADQIEVEEQEDVLDFVQKQVQAKKKKKKREKKERQTRIRKAEWYLIQSYYEEKILRPVIAMAKAQYQERLRKYNPANKLKNQQDSVFFSNPQAYAKYQISYMKGILDEPSVPQHWKDYFQFAEQNYEYMKSNPAPQPTQPLANQPPANQPPANQPPANQPPANQPPANQPPPPTTPIKTMQIQSPQKKLEIPKPQEQSEKKEKKEIPILQLPSNLIGEKISQIEKAMEKYPNITSQNEAMVDVLIRTMKKNKDKDQQQILIDKADFYLKGLKKFSQKSVQFAAYIQTSMKMLQSVSSTVKNVNPAAPTPTQPVAVKDFNYCSDCLKGQNPDHAKDWSKANKVIKGVKKTVKVDDSPLCQACKKNLEKINLKYITELFDKGVIKGTKQQISEFKSQWGMRQKLKLLPNWQGATVEIVQDLNKSRPEDLKKLLVIYVPIGTGLNYFNKLITNNGRFTFLLNQKHGKVFCHYGPQYLGYYSASQIIGASEKQSMKNQMGKQVIQQGGVQGYFEYVLSVVVWGWLTAGKWGQKGVKFTFPEFGQVFDLKMFTHSGVPQAPEKIEEQINPFA